MAIRPTTSPVRRGWAVLASVALVAGMTTALPAGADQAVLSQDFSDGTYAPLTASGGAELSVVDVDGDPALLVAGRDADYVGIQTPNGLLEPGQTYTVSADVRLADGVPDLSARIVAVPGYDWIGNTTVSAGSWTTLSGEWQVPDDAEADARFYVGTNDLDTGEPYDYYVDNFSVLQLGGGGVGAPTALTNDFEESLDPWQVRGSGDATAAITDTESFDGERSALVSGRTDAWNGLAAPIAGLLAAEDVYHLTAAVKLPEGTEGSANIRISVEREIDESEGEKWVTLTTVENVSASGWSQVDLTFAVPGEPGLLYFETASGTSDFLVDAVVISGVVGEVQDLQPIQDTVTFPVGVAIDERETTGAAGELTARHFNQITAENHMKPENWYDAERNFRPDPQVATLMDFAIANDLDVYGHVLVWHSQVPDWFFQHDDGEPLDPSDSEILHQRLRDHIFNVAEVLADQYGLFGSETNPLVAWDVVNEVVSDDFQDDGLRRSEWYRILGPDYVDLAFQYAEEAFNDVYAAPGAERPIALFINDYNTEQGGKQDSYFKVIQGLLDRGAPLDGVGHQFHVNLSTPIVSLDGALERFAQFPVVQAVTELDVTIGQTRTQALLIEQGHFYRDAFNVFRDHADDMFSVTIWGLTDGRSWRSEQYPLVFDDSYQAKQAYHGIVNSDQLTPIIKRGVVFKGDAPITGDALTSQMWQDLPLREVGTVGGFQLRWGEAGLLVYVEAPADHDAVVVQIDEQQFMLADLDNVTADLDGATHVLAHIPVTLEAGQAIKFDLTIVQGASETAWNPGDSLGDLVLVESLSVVEAAPAEEAPVVDAERDAAYDDAEVLTTGVVVEGEGSATAEARSVWHDEFLYVFVEVTDPVIDLSASNPWEQDSIELFIDLGNAKNGSYRSEDMQIRINVDNQLSFGTGDEALQRSRVTSATALTQTGYVVEAAIDLGEFGGAGSVQGFDLQVNDGEDGGRVGVMMWGDPTGLSYQSTERWGVVRLVPAGDVVDPVDPVDPEPEPTDPVTPGPARPGLPDSGM